ncbi:MAG: helix-turn-helix domain-containing protein [Christensenellales bacterium]|jgi:transcriptional regulator with XRE-family HTH domain
MKIYWEGSRKNVIGAKVKQLRLERGWTQKKLAQELQLGGYEFTDLTILRIEQGKRFVPDYELRALARVFKVPYDTLLD